MRALPASAHPAFGPIDSTTECTCPIPSNTRRKRSLLRRISNICADSKWISLASLLISFGIQSWILGTVSAMGLCFILASHEAGHLLASRRFNIPVLWPVFIPKVGAIIVLKDKIKNPYHEAWLGISGPILGLIATGVIHLWANKTGSRELAHCATAGYAIHAFNLIPLGDLDGGHIAPLVGRWLWILGVLIVSGLVVFCAELPWHVSVMIFFILWNGCSRIWDWLTSEPGMENMHFECAAKTSIGMAAIYCAAVFLSILGFLGSL